MKNQSIPPCIENNGGWGQLLLEPIELKLGGWVEGFVPTAVLQIWCICLK